MNEVFVVFSDEWDFGEHFEVFLSRAGAQKYCKMYNIPEYRIFRKFINSLV